LKYINVVGLVSLLKVDLWQW